MTKILANITKVRGYGNPSLSGTQITQMSMILADFICVCQIE